jgi:uncharacterized membrane protein
VRSRDGRSGLPTLQIAANGKVESVDYFLTAVVAATFLCALVTGLLLAFAVVVMPGLKTLDDGGFIRAFQVIDRVIQNNQPVFMLVWVGSVVLLIVAVVLGVGVVSGLERVLLFAAAALYILGVQLPTAAINVPLNNRLQSLAVDGLGDVERRSARHDFEPRWNRWNVVRTLIASAAVLLLLILIALL